MNTVNRWLGWINERNQRQIDWAVKYLRKAAVPMPSVSYPAPYQVLLMAEMHLISSGKAEKLVGKMKVAWNQKQFRDRRNGKKAYSLIISIAAKESLDKLAKRQNRPINETLDRFINECSDLEKTIRNDFDIEKVNIKENLKQKYQNINDRRLNRAQWNLTQLGKFIDNELLKQCQYLVRLEDSQPLAQPLTKDQELRVNEKLRALKERKEKVIRGLKL